MVRPQGHNFVYSYYFVLFFYLQLQSELFLNTEPPHLGGIWEEASNRKPRFLMRTLSHDEGVDQALPSIKLTLQNLKPTTTQYSAF